MIETETIYVPLPNRRALAGFILAILTLISFCAGFAPIPFTAIICYPASIILGILSLVLGLSALRRIRENGESGRPLALIAVWIGALTILLTFCMAVTGIMFLPHIIEFLRQTWNRTHP